MVIQLSSSFRSKLISKNILEILNKCQRKPWYTHARCDCEMAIKSVFPSTQVRLCRFHIVDAIRRHANAQGLRPICRVSENLRLRKDCCRKTVKGIDVWENFCQGRQNPILRPNEI